MRNHTRQLRRQIHIGIAATIICLCASSATSQELSDQLTAYPNPTSAPFDNLQTLNGNTLTADHLKGRVVLVNFWATWCPPCIEELPTMQSIWERYSQDGLEVLAVAVAENKDTVGNFLKDSNMRLEFPIILDEGLKVFKQWNVTGLPTTFAVDRNGNNRYFAVGGRDFTSDNISGIIESLINE